MPLRKATTDDEFRALDRVLMTSFGIQSTWEQWMDRVGRDNLRVLTYLDQRFGTTVQVSDEEVARYYREHESEFTRGGELIPFDEGESVARQRASSERRRASETSANTRLAPELFSSSP